MFRNKLEIQNIVRSTGVSLDVATHLVELVDVAHLSELKHDLIEGREANVFHSQDTLMHTSNKEDAFDFSSSLQLSDSPPTYSTNALLAFTNTNNGEATKFDHATECGDGVKFPIVGP